VAQAQVCFELPQGCPALATLQLAASGRDSLPLELAFRLIVLRRQGQRSCDGISAMELQLSLGGGNFRFR
jgi:hypothetical protein